MKFSPKGKTRRRKTEPVVVTNGSMLKFLVALVVTLIFLRLWVAEVQITMSGPSSAGDAEGDNEDYHALYVPKNKNRCWDDDDPKEWKTPQGRVPEKYHCQCPDPFQAKKRPGGSSQWDAFHSKLVEDVNYANALSLETGNPLELVILGDSLTERWNGTTGNGSGRIPENRLIFEKYFGKGMESSTTAPLHGIALGSAGDISVELQWHIQQGMLPMDARGPTVFLLLIGTNDLGPRSGCSKRTTVAGILETAQRVSTERPHAIILLHGLLPRSDTFRPGDYALGRYWKDILWINRELKRHAALWREKNWHYMEAGDVFLQRMKDEDHPEGDARGAVVINPELMPDGLHPNARGYDLWGPRIVERVQKAIAEYKASDP